MLNVTQIQIDHDALAHNLKELKKLAGNRKILASVKAQAYGHGGLVVARQIQDEQLADYLGVATTPEALQLRDAGITLPILRLSPAFSHELAALVQANIDLTVHDEQTINQLAAFADQNPRVHLAIDTGMHRIGCEASKAVEMAKLIEQANLDFAGIFTHLPVADTPDGEQFTTAQLAKFRQVVTEIQDARAQAGLAPVELIHAANSAATLSYDLEGCTMVRPGIAVYGYYPDAQTPRTIELQPVMQVLTRISALRRVPAGEPVGYGGTWKADEPRWIATVPIGYADGYPRSLSNRAQMIIGGQKYPIAGRICMDQTMLDVGSAEKPCQVGVGDPVIVMGRQGKLAVTADDIADLAGTISYEILVGFGLRAAYNPDPNQT